MPLVAHFVCLDPQGKRVLMRMLVPSIDAAREYAALRSHRVVELSVWQGQTCVWHD